MATTSTTARTPYWSPLDTTTRRPTTRRPPPPPPPPAPAPRLVEAGPILLKFISRNFVIIHKKEKGQSLNNKK